MFTSSPRTVGKMLRKTLRWAVLLPVVMVGSLLYWSVAIGLGGLSLMAAGALSASVDNTGDSTLGVAPQDTETESATLDVAAAGATLGTPIVVRLEESVEPEDVNDNAGAAGFTQQTDDQQVIVAPGPGSTSY